MAFTFSRIGSLISSFPRIFGTFILFFFVFVQCASSKNFIFGTVFVRKGFTPDKKARHVVFPVQIRSGWLMKNQNADQKKFLESRSYEKLELAILEYGGKVQDKYNAEKQYRTAFAAENSFSEEKGIQIAKQLKGDVVVFTDMTDYGTASGNSVMEVTVKAMDVDNGEILWKAIYSGKARGLQDNIDISILESEIFEHLTDKLKNKTE
ncbi:hypothetical protein EFP84_05995 [Leptospira kmetyi]|uniref:Lipoprotein n=1 Tax=Leptospira kmetyi TaxID=408139 RepID=A0AAD0UQS1_9LEPT|nr:hypothetical protein EFP84_05995 [Leptospira kmetyi]